MQGTREEQDATKQTKKMQVAKQNIQKLLLLLSRFSRVQLCDPIDSSPSGSPSLGFFRQEHWSGLPFPSPMHESEVAQSCPTLSDPMDCSPPGSSVHRIFQARVLEWGAIAFSIQNLVVKNSPANARDIRDLSLIPGWRRSPGERNGNPLQYSCLENLMDRGAWWATVHRVMKTQLKRLSICF